MTKIFAELSLLSLLVAPEVTTAISRITRCLSISFGMNRAASDDAHSKGEKLWEVICLIAEKGNQEEKAETLILQGLTKPAARAKALLFVWVWFFYFGGGTAILFLCPYEASWTLVLHSLQHLNFIGNGCSLEIGHSMCNPITLFTLYLSLSHPAVERYSNTEFLT